MKYVPLILLTMAACSPTGQTVTPGSSEAASASSSSTITSVAADNVIPDAFTGRWDVSTAACADGSELKLTVAPASLQFYESHGAVETVSVTGPTDIKVVAAMSGEGAQWQRTLHMVLGDSGKTLTIDDGTGGVRIRCP